MYVASYSYVYALSSSNGQVVWSVALPATAGLHMPLVVASASVQYLVLADGSFNNLVWLAPASGGVVWNTTLRSPAAGPPVLDAAGTMFVVDISGYVYAFNPYQ